MNWYRNLLNDHFRKTLRFYDYLRQDRKGE